MMQSVYMFRKCVWVFCLCGRWHLVPQPATASCIEAFVAAADLPSYCPTEGEQGADESMVGTRALA